MALVLGAGKMGKAIAYDLMKNNIETRICDIRETDFPNFFRLDVRDEESLMKEFKREDVVISALPYDFNYMLAKMAIKTKTSFIDLGGNSYIVEKELDLDEEARKAGIAIIPDCGLAPGMTNIIAYYLWQGKAEEIHIRVGGLPQEPKPPLNYALFFSVHGLINEYLEDSIIVKNGKLCKVESLTGLEEIIFDEFGKLEAFYTHGGVSTLPNTMKGIKELDYKTVRYKGHAEKIIFLKQIGFFSREAREFTEKILEKNLPKNEKDVVLAKIYSNEEEMQMIDYHNNFSAMARTTGFSTAIIAKMILDGEIKEGAHPPEIAVDAEKFMKELEKRNIKWRRRSLQI